MRRVPCAPLVIWSWHPLRLRAACEPAVRHRDCWAGDRRSPPSIADSVRRRTASISQLAKWPEMNITPLPRAFAASMILRPTTSMRGFGPCSRICPSARIRASSRPRLSHISRRMVSISVVGLFGIGRAQIVARAFEALRRCDKRSRPMKPPTADARSMPSSRKNPMRKERRGLQPVAKRARQRQACGMRRSSPRARLACAEPVKQAVQRRDRRTRHATGNGSDAFALRGVAHEILFRRDEDGVQRFGAAFSAARSRRRV